MRQFLFVVPLLTATAASAATNCQLDRFNFMFGQDTSASLIERAGMPCTIHINDLAGVRSTSIAQAPASGMAWAADNHHFTYKSKPGYHGPDRFVVAIDGASSSNNRGRVFDGVTHVEVDVNVVP